MRQFRRDETHRRISGKFRARTVRLTRVYVEGELTAGSVVELPRDTAAHLAKVLRARSVDRESPFAITLVQCVPRGDRMDFIVQKATELGVARIVPVLSQRSVVRLDKAHAESKSAHWRAVAVSACEQCGRNRLPAVEAAQPLLSY